MSAVPGQLSPLPGGVYDGTMSYADIYPTHVGIGAVTTQDRSLPAFGEATVAAANRSAALTNPQDHLFTAPAGWLAGGFLALVALAIVMREK